MVAGYKPSEHTLRALLGVPGPQLKQVLKQAEGVKVQMAKLLTALSSEEKEEVPIRWTSPLLHALLLHCCCIIVKLIIELL